MSPDEREDMLVSAESGPKKKRRRRRSKRKGAEGAPAAPDPQEEADS